MIQIQKLWNLQDICWNMPLTSCRKGTKPHISIRNSHGHGKFFLVQLMLQWLTDAFWSIFSQSCTAFQLWITSSFSCQLSVNFFYHSVIYSITSKFLTLPPLIGSVGKGFVGFICNNINYCYETSSQSIQPALQRWLCLSVNTGNNLGGGGQIF